MNPEVSRVATRCVRAGERSAELSRAPNNLAGLVRRNQAPLDILGNICLCHERHAVTNTYRLANGLLGNVDLGRSGNADELRNRFWSRLSGRFRCGFSSGLGGFLWFRLNDNVRSFRLFRRIGIDDFILRGLIRSRRGISTGNDFRCRTACADADCDCENQQHDNNSI